MRFNNNNLSGNEFQSNEDSPDIGAKIALWGSIVSTFGDAIQAFGGAIAIQESVISDIKQQQALDKLQAQIDELKKSQSQTNDMETFTKLLQQIVDRLDSVDTTKTRLDVKDEN